MYNARLLLETFILFSDMLTYTSPFLRCWCTINLQRIFTKLPPVLILTIHSSARQLNPEWQTMISEFLPLWVFILNFIKSYFILGHTY